MSDLLKVRVGGSAYLCKWDDGKYVPSEYVQIGSLLWTTKNLDLDLGTEGVNQLTHTWPAAGKLYTLGLILDTLQLGEGWRIPTDSDFWALRTYVQNHSGSYNLFQALVTTDNDYNSYENGMDLFGFDALITGYGTANSSTINNLKRSTNFWTQTESPGHYYYDWCLEGGNDLAEMYHNKDAYMLCIRLCKDV